MASPSPNVPPASRRPSAAEGGAREAARPGVIGAILAGGLLTLGMIVLLSRGAGLFSRPDPPLASAGDGAAAGGLNPRTGPSAGPGGVSPARSGLTFRPKSGTPAAPGTASQPVQARVTLSDRWGIEVTSVGVAARGSALDLRYKVVDVAKATAMVRMTNLVYLLDESSGRRLFVPFQRENQTSQKLVAGKTYFALVPNKGDQVKPGSRVTLFFAGAQTENLVVN